MFDPQHSGLLYFEDLRLDEPITLGAMPVTADTIKDYARRYDPQAIHLDEAAAEASIVKGLCASGFHTCCMMMRMLCDHYLLRAASLGAPGLDSCAWKAPVRPGHVLSVRMTVRDKRVLASRPDVGIANAIYEVLNQHGEVLLASTCPQMLRVRAPEPVAAPKPAGEKRPTQALASLWDAAPGPSPSRTGNHFEDRLEGETVDLGSHTFERDEIIAFAQQFDPQPFHLTKEAGKASLFGALAASGWHTVSHMVRLIVAERQQSEAALRAAGRPLATYGPSPGFSNLKWLRPVLVGDTISFRHRITRKQDLRSRPDRGILHSHTQGRNQRGEIVFAYDGMILVERRR
jgi:acyl dehydratase